MPFMSGVVIIMPRRSTRQNRLRCCLGCGLNLEPCINCGFRSPHVKGQKVRLPPDAQKSAFGRSWLSERHPLAIIQMICSLEWMASLFCFQETASVSSCPWFLPSSGRTWWLVTLELAVLTQQQHVSDRQTMKLENIIVCHYNCTWWAKWI